MILSLTNHAVLTAIVAHYRAHGRYPTSAEIAKATGLPKNRVGGALTALCLDGLITRGERAKERPHRRPILGVAVDPAKCEARDKRGRPKGTQAPKGKRFVYHTPEWDQSTACKGCGRNVKSNYLWWPARLCDMCMGPPRHGCFNLRQDLIDEAQEMSDLDLQHRRG